MLITLALSAFAQQSPIDRPREWREPLPSCVDASTIERLADPAALKAEAKLCKHDNSCACNAWLAASLAAQARSGGPDDTVRPAAEAACGQYSRAGCEWLLAHPKGGAPSVAAAAATATAPTVPQAPAPTAPPAVSPGGGKFEWAALPPLPSGWYGGYTTLVVLDGRRLLAIHTDGAGGPEERLEAESCGTSGWVPSHRTEPATAALADLRATTATGDRFRTDESGTALSREPRGGPASPVTFPGHGYLRVSAGGPWVVVQDGNSITRNARLSLSRDGGQSWTTTTRFADREVIVLPDPDGVFVLDGPALNVSRDGSTWAVTPTIGLEPAPHFGQLVNCQGMLVLMSEDLELWNTFAPAP